MSVKPFLLLAIAGLALGSWIAGPAPAGGEAAPERLSRLVQQLGSDQFREREEATRALEAVGAAALETLRRAADDPDMEVKRRSEELVRRITERVEREKLLAPKRVRLRFEDTPLEKAVADLGRQGGYPVVLVGDKALKERRVTLTTGETSFWEALDLFCLKAGLVEADERDRANRPSPQGAPQLTVPLQPIPAVPPQALPVLPPPGNRRLPLGKLQVPGQPAAPVPVVPVPVQARAVPLIVTTDMTVANTGRSVAGARRIVLTDGIPKTPPTDYRGAVRVRALNGQTVKHDGGSAEVTLTLEFRTAPSLTLTGIEHLAFGKVEDDQGQTLTESLPEPTYSTIVFGGGRGRARIRAMTIDPPAPHTLTEGRFLPVRLKAGEKPADQIKALQGTLSARVRTAPEAVLAADRVMDAKNKEVKGPNGERLTVVDVSRNNNRIVAIKISLHYPATLLPYSGPAPAADHAGEDKAEKTPPGAAAEQVMNGLLLTDADGQPMRLSIGSSRVVRDGDGVTADYQLYSFPRKDRKEPSRLAFLAQRLVSLDIPFAFKDIPLAR